MPKNSVDPPPDAPRSPRRIFVVDDHDALREMLVMFIESDAGLTVSGTAASAEEALDRIDPAACDLVLLDVSMPGMNGIELARRLHARYPALPCLMLSAHAEPVYVRGALDAGARGYVTKGDPAAILTAIDRVLRGEVYLSKELRLPRKQGTKP